jgi:DNA-binding MarR family transcriptional regulator
MFYYPFVSKDVGVDSSFSETELEVIRYLIEHPEMSHKDIAEERGVARGTVNNAVARIRDKTRTSFVTLIESPHTEEVAKEIDSEDLEQLLSELQAYERD